jgi:hypothetical protein
MTTNSRSMMNSVNIPVVMLLSLIFVVADAVALPVSTSVQVSGSSPTVSNSDQGNDASMSTAAGNYSTASGSTGGFLVNAYAQNPTVSSPVSLNQSAAFTLSNSLTTSGPWDPSFFSGNLQSTISSLDFLIGSYSAPTGTLVNGVLSIDLSVAVSSYGDHSPVIVTTTGGWAPETRVNFSQYPTSPLATSLGLGSNIGVTLDDKTAGTQFTGSVRLSGGNLTPTGSQDVTGSTILEIPFTTYVGNTMSFEALLQTYFDVRWYSVLQYLESFSLSIEDPITLNLLTPDAYYSSSAGAYFGPDQYQAPATVSEPGIIALMAIALLGWVFSQRRREATHIQ